jgi:hypothetical protein
VVDHINGDTLDNRRANLRVCTKSENNRNRRKLHPTTSRFKGVYKNTKPWIALIECNGKQFVLGRFASEEEAALAYDKAAKEHFGSFARLNFPPAAVAA